LVADLKACRLDPTPRRRSVPRDNQGEKRVASSGLSRHSSELRVRFNRIFRRSTGFATLDRLLQRLHTNKAELLMVLDHPEIPLHTNGSENDIRCQVSEMGGSRPVRPRP
jgi:hypothetical protein